MKITILAGSNRTNATSTALLKYIEKLLKDQQISVSFIDLSKLSIPLFSPDNGDFHPNVQQMLTTIEEGNGLVIGTPEYHGSISGTLKNALDYLLPDRVEGKTVLSVSSAGGPLGVSSLTHLQAIMRNLHGINSPEWISVGNGPITFDSDGIPADKDIRNRIQDAVHQFVELTRKVTSESEVTTP